VCSALTFGGESPPSPRLNDQRPAPKASTKPPSKKTKPASGRAKKVKATAGDGEEED
jgi:hypothetical protein